MIFKPANPQNKLQQQLDDDTRELEDFVLDEVERKASSNDPSILEPAFGMTGLYEIIPGTDPGTPLRIDAWRDSTRSS
jgi:hypothetical protein